MQIHSQFEHKGNMFIVEYSDGTPEYTDSEMLDGVHAYCFYGDKLVIVYNERDDAWTPPGGSIEKGETYEEAAVREVREESNMNVLHMECIGYQDIEIPWENRTVRQFRMVCIVEPYGDFRSDPDGDVSEIKLIKPEEYRKYIAWGEIGDHLMSRALEIKKSLHKGTRKF